MSGTGCSPMPEQSCGHCGASMKLYRAGARYCSGACRVAAHRARKKAAEPVPESVLPVEMTSSPRWVRWELQDRGGRTTKVPLRADSGHLASVSVPNSWTSYEAAVASQHGDGIGWVLGNGIGCIDLDHCIDGRGALADWAREIVDEHREDALLIEVSQSGRGLHIFRPMARGRGRVRPGVEVYPPDSGRYIAVTGRRFTG